MIELLLRRAEAAGIPSRISGASSDNITMRMIWQKSLGPEVEE